MVSKFFKKFNWGSNIGKLQRLRNYKESEYNICVKVQILTNGKQYHLPVMGLIICIHYKTPSVWPGILRIMSFNRADSNNTWKGGGWRNTDRHYNLGNKTFVFEFWFRKRHLEDQLSNVPVQGLKKSIQVYLTGEMERAVWNSVNSGLLMGNCSSKVDLKRSRSCQEDLLPWFPQD